MTKTEYQARADAAIAELEAASLAFGNNPPGTGREEAQARMEAACAELRTLVGYLNANPPVIL